MASGNKSENGWRPSLNRPEMENVDIVSETESEESDDASGSEQEETSWISWFCNANGNQFFCEVEEDYIEDDFNLSGLSSMIPYYDLALDLILDQEPAEDVMLTDQEHELLESAAEMLYGLIHARYILTARGLATMLDKYMESEFGCCPRVLCEGQACLPVGSSDIPGQTTVKIFCPKCEECYTPRSEYQCDIDGAYFGTTFPHLLLLTYPACRPPKAVDRYIPRIFGFKLHPTAFKSREIATPRSSSRRAIEGVRTGGSGAAGQSATGASRTTVTIEDGDDDDDEEEEDNTVNNKENNEKLNTSAAAESSKA
mmetsp:Transcript_18672/g.33898  ORF Transcript_18672/g.33898 Transcript_18672/m.33898 type:complete len:313 (-) Transcript_18672:879-1817(-)|eukprot:CAMPEP_0175045226 /NCGR_PEP_ID=MMETSP0052_2-20121109/4284_1 /TAXON_ID=51329 ORGANISM="Polytomella parva, Strain SAG 63-3" /NCGR_SAMPLE_ID=MMETSP0052_2 /ASSEMBLY_ACC=CAM_ASM_000194 /LENGTH=312 /DNA_ID=CAMNT_0016308691 /DNA_START=140 /DNA_END=1078 /DNA_ORIENTATION=-